MPLRRVCVLSDPDPSADSAQCEAAAAVGRLLAENGITLVYDGTAEGVPGALADAVLAAGGRAVGVTVATEPARHAGLTELTVLHDTESRDAAAADLADAFLALPGGLASLDALFAIWSWGGYHEKPCGLLNTGDAYTALLRAGEDALVDRFVRETQRGMLIVDRDPAVLLRALADFRPPETRRLASFDDS